MDIVVGPLPDEPLAAAARFHAEVVPQLFAALTEAPEGLTLVFDPAACAHDDWRRAAVATLAREQAPARINGVAGEQGRGLAETLAYVRTAPGLTGQYLVVAPAD